MKKRKQRIRGLNRRAFKRNLKKALKEPYASDIDNYYCFEEWVNDYKERCDINGSFGFYELKANETKSGHVEEISTQYIY